MPDFVSENSLNEEEKAIQINQAKDQQNNHLIETNQERKTLREQLKESRGTFKSKSFSDYSRSHTNYLNQRKSMRNIKNN